MKREMTIDLLKCKADLNFEDDFGVNDAVCISVRFNTICNNNKFNDFGNHHFHVVYNIHLISTSVLTTTTTIGYKPVGFNVHHPSKKQSRVDSFFFAWVSSAIKNFSSKKSVFCRRY